jgi:hypothetical protein
MMLAFDGTTSSMTKRVHMGPRRQLKKSEETTLLAWMSLAGWCLLFMLQPSRKRPDPIG